MKKFVTILITAILLFSFSILCYAEEATLDDLNPETSIEVYARYEDGDDETPPPSSTPTDEPSSTPSSETITSSPQTGDNSKIGIWLIVMLISILALLGIFLYSNRKKT